MANPSLHDIDATGWQVQCWGEGGVINARLFYRGEEFGPVFEATSPRSVALRVARYLADVATELDGRPQ